MLVPLSFIVCMLSLSDAAAEPLYGPYNILGRGILGSSGVGPRNQFLASAPAMAAPAVPVAAVPAAEVPAAAVPAPAMAAAVPPTVQLRAGDEFQSPWPPGNRWDCRDTGYDCHKARGQCWRYQYQCKKTCGLCYGQTPDPSLTCYDQIGEEQCRGLADKCFQYKGVCKKTCGMCGSTTPHPSVSCYDEMPSECPRLAQTNCQRYGSQCKKSCGLCPGTQGVTTHPSYYCADQWPTCKTDWKDACFREDVKRGCCQHCGLGQGMTRHLSNTCYDNFADEKVCARLARTNCHGFAQNCRKTCGLCTEPGYNVPHPTMTCYDEYKNCDDIARDGCWRPENQRKCCLSCGLGPGGTPALSLTCYDEYTNCPQLARDSCHQNGSKCLKSCGLCPNPPYNVPHPSNTCYDRYSPWDCRTMCNGYQREMCRKTCGLCSTNG